MTPRQRRSAGGRVPGRIVLASVAVVLAGCAAIWPSTYSTTFPANDDPGAYPVRALPVDVIDTTGLVTGVSTAEVLEGSMLWRRAHHTVAGTTIHVEWLGGACEARVRAIFGQDGDGFAIRMEDEPTIGGMVGCPALGVARAIDIHLRESIDGAAVQVKSPLE